MGRLLRQYKAGQMSLRKYEKLVPAVASIIEIFEMMEEVHVGFRTKNEVISEMFILDRGTIDISDLDELEGDIDWILSCFYNDEQEIIRMMVNEELGYEGRDDVDN